MSAIPVTLGIDLGLSGARATLMDARGRLLGQGRAALTPGSGAAGQGAQDPTAWLSAVIAAGRSALEAAEATPGGLAVEAIGIGALGPCPVLLDRRQQPLAPAALFGLDDSAEPWRQRLSPVPGPDHVLPKLLALAETAPDLLSQAACVSDAAGFLVASLTGRPVMDPATAAEHLWPDHPPVLAVPEILPGDSLAAGLHAEGAAALGLRQGTPVTVGGFDCWVDLLGLPEPAADEAWLLAGSTLLLGRPWPHPVSGEGLVAARTLGPDWYIGGWTATAGSALDWLERLLGPEARSEAARREPFSHGLAVLPALAGERAPLWQPDLRGAILGLSLATDAADLLRAMLDAVALSALDLLERLCRLTGPIRGLRAIGGGLRHPALAQALADALGLDLPVPAEAGLAAGPARLGWRALGETPPAAPVQWLTPNPERHRRYQSHLALHRDLFPALAPPLRRLRSLRPKAVP